MSCGLGGRESPDVRKVNFSQMVSEYYIGLKPYKILLRYNDENALKMGNKKKILEYQTKTMRVISMREDWLKVMLWVDSSGKDRIADDMIVQFEGKKAELIERRRKDADAEAYFTHCGRRWYMRPKGMAQGGGVIFFPYVFDCEGITFAVSEIPVWREIDNERVVSKNANAMMDVNGVACMRLTLDEIIIRMYEFESFLRGRYVKTRVSRVDLTADVYGKNIWVEVNRLLTTGSYVTRLQSKSSHTSSRLRDIPNSVEGVSFYSDDDETGLSGEGVRVGRSNAILRIYAKAWEIEKKGGVSEAIKKAELIGRVGFEPGRYDVARFECQTMSAKLRELGISSIETYLEKRREAFLWCYIRHFRLVEKKYKNGNQKKSPIHSIWAALIDYTKTLGDRSFLKAIKPECQPDKILKQGLGCLKTYAAAVGSDVQSFWELLKLIGEETPKEMRDSTPKEIEKRRREIWGE